VGLEHGVRQRGTLARNPFDEEIPFLCLEGTPDRSAEFALVEQDATDSAALGVVAQREAEERLGRRIHL